MSDPIRTLPDALAAAALKTGRVTVRGPGGSVVEASDWAAIAEDNICLARRLLSTGLKAGARIGLMAETDLAFIRLFLACQRAGLVPVPLPLPGSFGYREAHADKLARLLAACDARAAVAAPALLPFLPGGLDLAATPADMDALPESRRGLPVIGEDDVAFLQFSSGSTRFPKGVVVTHRNLIANARGISAALNVGDGDICVSWLPLYHDMGLVGCLLTPLFSGTDLHLLPTREFIRNPLLWPRLMAETGGTIAYSPAFGYELAARRGVAEALRGLDLTRWRVAGLGGDMIRPQVLARFAEIYAPAGFRAAAFCGSYGLAEATLAVTLGQPGAGLAVSTVDMEVLEREGRVVPAAGGRARVFARCGVPIPGLDVDVRDAAGRTLPEGHVGRIFVGGPSVMGGYFREPEETARVMSPDGWLDTGDLGTMDGGQLLITGRAKDLIIVNGRNIWPHDLEWAAERIEPLRAGDVAAVAAEGEDGAEQAVLLVQCRSADPAERDRLATQVAAAAMADSGVLCRVVLVPSHALPRTSSGKLARAHARRLLAEGRFG
ncbi:MAG: fatty acyl-AMP ligase [Rhodospirillaceae bacterium]|nr:fatty acyl-AMP ligase [Rhodospirillales bacterium]